MGLKRTSEVARRAAGLATSLVGTILLELLDDFEKATDVMAYRARNYDHVLRIKAGKERQRRYQALQRMKRQQLVTIRKTVDGLSVALTAAGRAKGLREQIRQQTNRLPKGQSCIVIFDIPERAKLGRQTFRKFLKDSGFRMIQLSVWESPCDVFDLVEQFIRHARIGRWVTVAQVTRKA